MDPLSPATLAPYLIGAVPAAGASSADSLGDAARAFEAQFIYQMLRQMRASMAVDGEGGGYGAETLGATLDVELASQISRNGGVGFAQMMMAAINGTSAGGATKGTNAGGATVRGFEGAKVGAAEGARVPEFAAAPVTAPSHLPPHPPSTLRTLAPSHPEDLFQAPITSNFGWRNDPFSGARKFHSGVDIAMAYGVDVPAAEAGRVVVAEAQGRYGNTVVIEHASGAQTRYAHLSDILVRPGDTVPAGYTLGRAGSSGAATGPHLHFEVIVDNRRMNPRSAEARASIQQLPDAAD
jgi:murein DD-endopeptidase MepM/ murein hydrolase activator NlpD